MTQFQERWQKVEKGKKEMKMNFIKYNNIVKVNEPTMDQPTYNLLYKHSGQATKSCGWTEQIHDGKAKTVDNRQESQITVQRIVRLKRHVWIIDGDNQEETVLSRFFRNSCKYGTKWLSKCTKFYEQNSRSCRNKVILFFVWSNVHDHIWCSISFFFTVIF